MRQPLLLLFLSILAGLIALAVPGFGDLALLAGICALASLILLVAALLRVKPADRAGPKWVIVDGSNVLHWKGGAPQLSTVREVLAHLSGLGFSPGVVFDANAGYLVSDRYLHHADFARLLGLPEDRVMVVPKGSPADETILAAARELGARVVSNDRYHDWIDRHPELSRPDMLIRGGFRDGVLWLALDTAAPPSVRGRSPKGS